MSILYGVIFFIYTIYSYAHTDPNLIYSSNSIFLEFQRFMWKFGMENRPMSTLIYFLLVVSLFGVYVQLIRKIKNKEISHKKAMGTVIGCALILMFSNPGLSHDIFNYMFNARMVVEYQANPHRQTALEYENDSWTRFMHNTHTPAPYGYGWTALSLGAYALGFGNIKMTILTFKILVGLFFMLCIWFQAKLQKSLDQNNNSWAIFLFALNPLVLIETFSNGHNDVVMMAPALGAIYLFLHYVKTRKTGFMVASIMLLAISVSIKYASVALLGAGFVWVLSMMRKKNVDIGSLATLFMSTPLTITRSQQFLPWYLIWPLSFLPIISSKKLINILVIFSLASLLRYIPYIYLPLFDKPITDLAQRQIEVLITFAIPSLFVAGSYLKTFIESKKIAW